MTVQPYLLFPSEHLQHQNFLFFQFSKLSYSRQRGISVLPSSLGGFCLGLFPLETLVQPSSGQLSLVWAGRTELDGHYTYTDINQVH